MLNIRVRYCGGCNPEIDRVAIVERLKEELEKNNLPARFVYEEEEKIDIVLLVNGCRHACLEEQGLSVENRLPVISMEGEALGGAHMPQQAIPAILARKIIDLSPGEKRGRTHHFDRRSR